jgi:uncharacterized protein
MELARMSALLDTGFLLAVMDADDDLHATCAATLQAENDLLLPDVVLPELAYLVLRELGYAVLTKFLRSVAAGELPLVRTTPEDLERAAEVLEKYADSRVDFVDCVIVALAERLNVTRILTVDRRHFSLFRPKHCQFFEIAP